MIADLDDEKGTADWTPAERDVIRAEAVEILRGQHACPDNSALEPPASRQ